MASRHAWAMFQAETLPMGRVATVFSTGAAALFTVPCAAGLVQPGPCAFGAAYSVYGPAGGADSEWVASGALSPDPIMRSGTVGTSNLDLSSHGVNYALGLSAWYSVADTPTQSVVTGSLTFTCQVVNSTDVPAWVNANVFFTLPLEVTSACVYASTFWSEVGEPTTGESGYYAWSDLANSGSGAADLLPLFGAEGDCLAMSTSMGMGFGLNNAGVTQGDTGVVSVNISFQLVLTVPAPGLAAPLLASPGACAALLSRRRRPR